MVSEWNSRYIMRVIRLMMIGRIIVWLCIIFCIMWCCVIFVLNMWVLIGGGKIVWLIIVNKFLNVVNFMLVGKFLLKFSCRMKVFLVIFMNFGVYRLLFGSLFGLRIFMKWKLLVVCVRCCAVFKFLIVLRYWICFSCWIRIWLMVLSFVGVNVWFGWDIKR